MKTTTLLHLLTNLVFACFSSSDLLASGSSGGVVLYQTTFNALSSGAGTVVGQDGWVGSPSPGPHGTAATFPDQGQAMFIGSLPFTSAIASFKRPVNYDPVTFGTPVVRFSTEIMLNDSTNGFRDDFGFQIHNSDGEFLASIIFDNEQNLILVDDGLGGPVSTGMSFTNDTALFLDMEIDFADNYWVVWLNGVEIISYEPFTNSGETLTIGDVTVYWAPHDTANAGDNQLFVDNWSLIAYGYNSMASNGIGIVIQDDSTADPYPSSNTITGLTGRLNRITVRIDGLTHTSTDNLDILLVAPDGRSVVLLSDVGGNSNMSTRSVVIDDLAPASLMASSVPVAYARYRPTDYAADATFPAPVPTWTPLTTLSGLYGMNPNGTWKLCIVDDTVGDTGSISAWSLELGTDGGDPETFEVWQDTYFTAGEISGGQADWDFDDDSDGLLNLFEYAFGMNPRGNDSSSPNAPTTFPVTYEGEPCLGYQYLKDTSKTELMYELEVSSDMVNWFPFTGDDVIVSQVGYVETHQAYVPTSSGNNNIRLRITIP